MPAVAALHAEGLPHEFFVRLGGRFLRAYHRGFVEGPHGVMYVARRGEQVVGFVTGASRASDHSRWVVRHQGTRLAVLGLRGMLLRPRELRTFLRTRAGRYLRGIRRRVQSRRGKAPEVSAGPEPRRGSMAVLHHVVVDPDARGQGLGGALVTAFVEDVRGRGARHARLVTLAESGAGALYERLGWCRGRRRVGPDGHLRVEYDLELDGSAPGRRALGSRPRKDDDMDIDAGSLRTALEATAPVTEALIGRIWDRDHTVWQDDPTEVADRLGWLDCPESMQSRVDEFRDIAAGARADGLEHVLLVGMGGSSLYPEVLATSFPAAADGLSLTVLDSTHPDAVSRTRQAFDPERTLLVAASKSGSTIETRSHLDRFWADLVDAVGEQQAGAHVVAITDPGSELAALGRDRGFRAVVENPSDIGGRFSALSAFGLMPATLLGLDVPAHLSAARSMAEACRQAELQDNPGARLGAVMAEAAAAGRGQTTVLLPREVSAFGAWIEQLVAESTGKQQQGLLPIVDEPVLPPEQYGEHRLVIAYGDHPGLDEIAARDVPVVRLPAITAQDLPAEVFRWEFATAVAGALMGINPFDQPNVQAAKKASTRMLEEGSGPPEPVSAEELLSQVGQGDHIALLGFVDPGGDVAGAMADLADGLRERHGVPVTIGVGPRYLHSTGQLHKGGPDRGVYPMLLEEADGDVDVPGRDFTFDQLFRAQAAGDLIALHEAGRRAGLVRLDDLRSLLD